MAYVNLASHDLREPRLDATTEKSVDTVTM